VNEHVGFVVCPKCDLPWQDGQWACPYCHSSEPPAAVKAAGPAWMWWLLGAIALVAAGIDHAYGGHGLRTLQKWFPLD
jgi:hypothetical protein